MVKNHELHWIAIPKKRMNYPWYPLIKLYRALVTAQDRLSKGPPQQRRLCHRSPSGSLLSPEGGKESLNMAASNSHGIPGVPSSSSGVGMMLGSLLHFHPSIFHHSIPPFSHTSSIIFHHHFSIHQPNSSYSHFMYHSYSHSSSFSYHQSKNHLHLHFHPSYHSNEPSIMPPHRKFPRDKE